MIDTNEETFKQHEEENRISLRLQHELILERLKQQHDFKMEEQKQAHDFKLEELEREAKIEEHRYNYEHKQQSEHEQTLREERETHQKTEHKTSFLMFAGAVAGSLATFALIGLTIILSAVH